MSIRKQQLLPVLVPGLLLAIVAASSASADLTVIYDSGQTQPLSPLLGPLQADKTPATDPAKASDPNRSSKSMLGPAELSNLLPLHSPGLEVGDSGDTPLSPEVLTRLGQGNPRPFFLVGSDAVSLQWLAYHRDISDFELAGTEPAGLFISHNGGDQWQARPEVAQLRDRHNWYLPYSPAAGAIRGLAVRGDHLYAAVEVGGLLRSVDRGVSWQLAGGSSGQPSQRGTADQIDADIHDIVVAGQNPLHLLAATQTGLYESRDGGDSWRRLYGPAYCRAVWADPDRPNHLLLGPAYGVDRNGTIQHSQDGGQSWRDASHGLPTPWPRTMVERFYQVGSQLIAVLSDGNLLQSHIGVWQWRPLLPEITQARAVWSLNLNP